MVDKFQVLTKFRPFLNFLLNSLPEQIQITNKYIRFLLNNSQKIVNALFVLGTLIFIVSNAWFCIDEKFKLEVIALPSSLLLGDISMNLINMSIGSNGALVKKVVDFLQEIVDNRKILQ